VNLFNKIFPPAMSFRRQLLITVVVGVICLALAASLTQSWLPSRDTRVIMIEQGLQITNSFARQSILALLFEARENAEDSAAAILAFPNVSRVAIFNKQHEILLVDGATVDWHPPKELQLTSKEATLAQETPNYLHFAAPVYSARDNVSEMPFGSTTA